MFWVRYLWWHAARAYYRRAMHDLRLRGAVTGGAFQHVFWRHHYAERRCRELNARFPPQ